MSDSVRNSTIDAVADDSTWEVRIGYRWVDLAAVADGTALAGIAGSNPSAGSTIIPALGFEPIGFEDGHEKTEATRLSVNVAIAEYIETVVGGHDGVVDAANMSASIASSLYNQIVVQSDDENRDDSIIGVAMQSAAYENVTVSADDDITEGSTMSVSIQSASYVDITV